jgi:hypothetical protein
MKITVTEAAKLLDMSPQLVRFGLQQQRLPIGTAIKTSPNRWTYDCRLHLVNEYLGKR